MCRVVAVRVLEGKLRAFSAHAQGVVGIAAAASCSLVSVVNPLVLMRRAVMVVVKCRECQ